MKPAGSAPGDGEEGAAGHPPPAAGADRKPTYPPPSFGASRVRGTSRMPSSDSIGSTG